MSWINFLRYLTIEPVNLSRKEKTIAAFAGFAAILATALMTRAWAGQQAAVLVASMGASAAILFAIPSSPLAQPWPFAGGQIVSALTGVVCAAYIDYIPLAAATAAGSAILLMLLLRCLHPPGAATALAPVLAGNQTALPDFDFVLAPVCVNVLLMLISAWLINRLVLRRDYPVRIQAADKITRQEKTQDNLVGISRSDVEQVTRSFNHFLDIGNEELLQLFTRLQLLSFQKQAGSVTCGDIMLSDVVTVEYATEVEEAWALMYERQIKVLPVLDKSRRVIGIVTRYDFLKNLKLVPHRSFQEKWLAFVKRTPGDTTDKPEAIGHIMTRNVQTLPAKADIAELLPLIVNEGHHHIPVIDDDGRFLGMVFQSRVLSALFNRVALAGND